MSDGSAVWDRALDEVVLDWNGTVVADRPRAVQATNAVLEAHGLEPITGASLPTVTAPVMRHAISALLKAMGSSSGRLATAQIGMFVR